jgi:hypothetical protein
MVFVDVAVRCREDTTPSLISEWLRLRPFVSAWAAEASEGSRDKRTVVETSWHNFGRGASTSVLTWRAWSFFFFLFFFCSCATWGAAELVAVEAAAEGIPGVAAVTAVSGVVGFAEAGETTLGC